MTHIMVDEVEVMPWCDGHGSSPSLEQTIVGLMQSLVDIHKGVDDGLSVAWGLRNFRKHGGEQIWAHILQWGEEGNMSRSQRYFTFVSHGTSHYIQLC